MNVNLAIARFIDGEPEFLYVPADEVLAVAGTENAIPFDVPGVALSHAGDECSFDAFLRKHGLTDEAAPVGLPASAGVETQQ